LFPLSESAKRFHSTKVKVTHWRHWGADHPGWHPQMKLNFWGWIYKEHWTSDVGRWRGWEWRWAKKKEKRSLRWL